MDKIASEPVNWEPIIWIGGTIFTLFLTTITGLLAWIGRMQSGSLTKIDVRLEKHETWILKQQAELADLSKSTNTAIELIKQELILKHKKK